MIVSESDSDVWWSKGVIAAMRVILFGLLGATVIVYGLSFILKKPLASVKARTSSWWLMVLMFALAIRARRTGIVIFFTLVSYLALKEYLSMVPTRHSDRRVLLLAYLSVPVQYYFVHVHWYGMFVVFVPIYVFLLLATFLTLTGHTKGFLRSVGTLHWGVMMTVFSLSHVAMLMFIRATGDGRALLEQPHPSFVILSLLLTEINDVAQFCWGKGLGRFWSAKVLPSVSPGKTWVGLLGGVLSTTLLSVVVIRYIGLIPLSTTEAVIIGAGHGWFGFLGDVVISAVKRDLGVKDAGSTLPGHGGVLDRVDSLTFTAPLFFHFLYFWASRPEARVRWFGEFQA